MKRDELAQMLRWYRTLNRAAAKEGLKTFNDPEVFLINPAQAVAVAAWSGLEERYAHWSFGKKAEQISQGGQFPEEMVFPSRTPRVFLLSSPSQARNLRAMVRAIARLDFVSRNNVWKTIDYTRAWIDTREHAKILSGFAADPAIGAEALRNTLTAAQAIAPQCSHGLVLSGRSDDLLLETLSGSKILAEWQKKVLEIVHQEWIWFLPLIATSMMYDGWASFWELRLLREAGIGGELFGQCLEEYARTLAFPPLGELNHALIGFRLLEQVEKSGGKDLLLKSSEEEHDISFIEKYMTQEAALICGLFTRGQVFYEKDKLIVKELSDPKGWETVKKLLLKWSGENVFPAVRRIVNPLSMSGLTLAHVFEDRTLNEEEAEGTLRHLYALWGVTVYLTSQKYSDDQQRKYGIMWSFDGSKFDKDALHRLSSPQPPQYPAFPF